MKLKENKLQCLIIIMLIAVIFPKRTSAQDFHESQTFLISTNPVKLICGLINFEFEYIISPDLSLALSSEYLISDYIYGSEKHPDFVCRIGPRFHLLSQKEHSDRNDLFTGINCGYIWSRNNSKLKTAFISADIGYKYMIKNPFFLNSKIHVSYPLNNSIVLPGFEGLFGIIVK